MSDHQKHLDSTEFAENNAEESIIAEVVEDSSLIESKADGHKPGYSDADQPKREKTSWISKVKEKFTSTYSKRNPLVNALLSVYLIAATLISLFFFLMGCGMFFSVFTGEGILNVLSAVFLLFYSLYYLYYMYQFVVGNRKEAFLFTHMGSAVLYCIIFFYYFLFNTPDYIEDESGEMVPNGIFSEIVMGAICSLLLNTFLMGIAYLVMNIKKYGATAWTLLDVSNKRFRTKFDKVCFYLYFILLSLTILFGLISEYKSNHPNPSYPSHITAKVGDYYYDDGTISSEVLKDKKAVGVVFSIDALDTNSGTGEKHGQIISLNDLPEGKMQWETGEPKDYDNYPNYTWNTRLEALSDVSGNDYIDCEGNECLSINFNCNNYLQNKVDGISSWYVPTAGQFREIIENIGNTKVDNRLKFNAKKAGKNLKKINIDPKRWYWTITEFDADNAWSIRIASGEFGSRTYKKSKAYVRPIADF